MIHQVIEIFLGTDCSSDFFFTYRLCESPLIAVFAIIISIYRTFELWLYLHVVFVGDGSI